MEFAALKEIIEGGDIERARNIIETYPHIVNESNSDGVTYLMIASRQGNVNLINILVDNGAELDMRDTSGFTALHHAVCSRQLDAVSILISRGSDINLNDKLNHCNPLHWAVWNGYTDVVRKIFETKGKCDIQINQKNSAGFTPLHYACHVGNADIVRLLLTQSNIDINALDGSDVTPLHLAVKKQYYYVVTLMLSQDSVKVNTKTCDDKTPLSDAISSGHLGMMRELIASGVDINAIDNAGDNCLHQALKTGTFHSEVMHMDILDKCCTMLELTYDHRLSGAVVASYLASCGASFLCENKGGKTPLDLIDCPRLKEKIKALFIPLKCVFCEDEVATTQFLPCKHISLCKECCPGKMPKRCPVCEQNITSQTSLGFNARGETSS